MNAISRDFVFDLGFIAGTQTERERIIKLLEADKAHRQPHCSTKGCKECPIYEDGFNDAITLIKGQNK